MKNHLVRARVCPLIREKGTFCCGKSRCETYCKLKQADTFESFAARKVYKINHSFNCNSKCSVYLFSCKVCGNQYVHSTVDIDFDSGRTSANVAKGTHQMVEHSTKTISVNIFLGEGHYGLIYDCGITFIGKTESSRREFFWMSVLKTIASFGFNIDEGYDS